MHAGVDDPEGHVEVLALGNSQGLRLGSHQTGRATLAVSHDGRGDEGGLALLDAHGRLLVGEQAGRPQVVGPHLAVDAAGAD